MVDELLSETAPPPGGAFRVNGAAPPTCQKPQVGIQSGANVSDDGAVVAGWDPMLAPSVVVGRQIQSVEIDAGAEKKLIRPAF